MKRMGIQEKMLAVVETRALAHQEEQTKALAEAIDNEEFPDQKDPERVLRIERSIGLLAQLNELGGEIRPAIEPVNPGPKEELPRYR